jgi:hypothetical protein
LLSSAVKRLKRSFFLEPFFGVDRGGVDGMVGDVVLVRRLVDPFVTVPVPGGFVVPEEGEVRFPSVPEEVGPEPEIVVIGFETRLGGGRVVEDAVVVGVNPVWLIEWPGLACVGVVGVVIVDSGSLAREVLDASLSWSTTLLFGSDVEDAVVGFGGLGADGLVVAMLAVPTVVGSDIVNVLQTKIGSWIFQPDIK